MIHRLVHLDANAVKQRTGACYLLESATLFKLGSSNNPHERVLAQRYLSYPDGEREPVINAWIGSRIRSYAKVEKVFHTHIDKDHGSLREVWQKGVGMREPLLRNASLFRGLKIADLYSYFEMAILFLDFVDPDQSDREFWEGVWRKELGELRLPEAEYPMPWPFKTRASKASTA